MGQPNLNLYTRKGLTARQHINFYNNTERYWKGLNPDYIIEVDHWMEPHGNKGRKVAKYCKKWRYHTIIERQAEFMSAIQERYIKRATDLDTPCVRVQYEVGESWRVERRLPDHLKNTGTSPLFGLLHAWMTEHKPASTSSFKVPLQLTLFPVWKFDVSLIEISEILGSILCSSYHDEGGLNPVRGGGKGERVKSKMSAKDLRFDWGRKEALERKKHVLQAVLDDRDRLMAQVELYRRINEIPAQQARIPLEREAGIRERESWPTKPVSSKPRGT